MHIGCGSTAYSVETVYGGKERLYIPDVCPALVATPCLASLAITLLILSMTPNCWRPARLTPEHGHFSNNEEPHMHRTRTLVKSNGQILVSLCKQKEPEEKTRIDRHLETEYQKLITISRRHLELQALPIALPDPVQYGNTERRRPTASLTREGLLGPRLSH
jgi:hypothetical protein